MGKKVASFFGLILSDVIVLLICLIVAYFIRSEILPPFHWKFKVVPLYPLSHYLSRFHIVLAVMAIFAHERLYTKRFPLWEEVRILWKSTTIAFAFIMILVFLVRGERQFSRSIIILSWALSLLLLPLSRFLVKMLMRRTHIWEKNLLIIGANSLGAAVLEGIKKNPTLGYKTIGFIDADPQKVGKEIQGVKVVGPISELENIIQLNHSRDIIIAMPDLTKDELIRMVSTCEGLSETLWLVPRIGDVIATGVEVEPLGKIVALNLKRNLLKPWNVFIKNLYDIAGATVMIILLLPLFAIVSLWIKLDSPGPVMFVQERLGKRNKLFRFFKFRSMHMDSEKRLEQLLHNSPIAREEWQKFKKVRNSDPRVTRAGKIIRKYSIDELPQLFNVLQGKMSLVGPRPYILEELKGEDSFMRLIGRVRPGMTGLWQTSGRSELPFEERISLDKYYVHNWSLWFDIVILLKSIHILVMRKGAY
jgi:Undecaprenyl-phosphate galactose phosphotransferase WbaP